jgi:hypothetical protein
VRLLRNRPSAIVLQKSDGCTAATTLLYLFVYSFFYFLLLLYMKSAKGTILRTRTHRKRSFCLFHFYLCTEIFCDLSLAQTIDESEVKFVTYDMFLRTQKIEISKMRAQTHAHTLLRIH